MVCCGFILFIILALSSISVSVKVHVHGSLNLGKDIIKTLTKYMNQNYNSRRYLTYDSNEEDIYHTVNSTALCRKLDLCGNELGKFIVQYVTMLAKAVSTVLEGLSYLSNDGIKSIVKVPKPVIFAEKLKHVLKNTRKILKTANDKITDDNKTYVWIDIIKKICGKFQENAVSFVTERLGSGPEDIEVKKRLTQELVIETITVEAEFQTKLCSEHRICSKSYECTKALNTILAAFKIMDNDRAKTFVRAVYEVLPDTTFYSKLNEVTANEFQVVLNDMAYSEHVSTKEVLLTIQNTVENRLNLSGNHIPKGRDVELVQIILSDMDHIYSKHKAEPFYKHLNGFYDWVHGNGRLNSVMRQTMKDLSTQISSQSDDLIIKLITEVRVFLEITVDP